MKITCLKDNLKKGVVIIERIIGKNLNLPILSDVLIEAAENYLKLTTTDLEIGISVQIPVKTEKKGTICVPAKTFSNFISSLPDDKIELELKEERILSIKTERYQADIKGQNPQDFPIIPKVKQNAIFKLNGNQLSRGLFRVAEICSLSGLRPELAGVFFNIKNRHLKLAATDTFRLGECALDTEGQEEGSFIVPARSIQEIMRVFSESAEVEVIKDQNQIIFSNQNDSEQKIKIALTSRLIEGEYPSYEAIIPKISESEAIVDREKFLNQVRTAGFFSGRVNDIKIRLDAKKQEIEVSSHSPELGETKSRAAAEIKKEKDTEASFNYKFVLDGVNNIMEDRLVLRLNGYGGPTVFEPVETKDYVYALMPIKST